MICIRMSQMIAPALIAAADAPTPDHGKTEDRPNPVPNESKITARDANTNAPAMTAAHETPEEFASVRPLTSGRADVSTKEVSGREVTGAAAEYSIDMPPERTVKSETTWPETRYGDSSSRAIHRTHYWSVKDAVVGSRCNRRRRYDAESRREPLVRYTRPYESSSNTSRDFFVHCLRLEWLLLSARHEAL
jgi:hypothetical protein